jgi:hypothetical protein
LKSGGTCARCSCRALARLCRKSSLRRLVAAKSRTASPPASRKPFTNARPASGPCSAAVSSNGPRSGCTSTRRNSVAASGLAGSTHCASWPGSASPGISDTSSAGTQIEMAPVHPVAPAGGRDHRSMIRPPGSSPSRVVNLTSPWSSLTHWRRQSPDSCRLTLKMPALCRVAT